MSLHNLYAQVTKNNKRRALGGLLMVSVLLALACVPAFINLASADPEGDVAINEVNFPDPNFRSFITKEFDEDKNDVLSVSEINRITDMHASKKSISSLKGIEFFPKIERLWCTENQLTSLDLSSNNNLDQVWCDHNMLKSIDLPRKDLTGVYCWHNNFIALDVSCLDLPKKLNKQTRRRFWTPLHQKPCPIVVNAKSRALNLGSISKGFKTDKVTELSGATFSGNSLIANESKPNKITYKYIIDNNSHKMDVELQVSYVFDVVFQSNGGKGTMKSLQVKENESFQLPQCSFVAPTNMQHFKAWLINGREKHPGDTIKPSDNVVVKAIWTDSASVVSKIDSPEKPSSDFVSVTLKAADNGTIKNTDEAKGLDFWVKKNTQFSKVTEHVTISAADKYKFDKWTNEQTGAEVTNDLVITEALTADATFTDDFAQHEIVPKTDEHQVAPSQNHVLVELKAKANGTVTPNNTDNTTSFWVLKDKQVKFQDVTSKVTVTAADKYKFDKWTNEQTGAEVKDDFVITEALTANANFVPQDSSNPQGSASGTEGGGYSNGLVTMYRLYNPYSHEHLFTTDIMERDNLIPLGWKYELAVGGVYLHGEKGGVYRLYNPTTGEHHYTMDEEELANCVKAGWVNEGVKFFSASEDDGHVVGMVSMYNPYEKAFYHHYTSDEKEIKQMVKDGWIKEDIKWYVAK